MSISKIRYALALLWALPFSGQAQGLSRQAEVAAVLQKAGVIQADYRLQPTSAGFKVDTTRQRCISCDALFMEHLRSHTSPAQLAAVLQQTDDYPATSFPENGTTVFRPLAVDDLLFVLVQKATPSGNPKVPARNTASLVVLKDTNGVLSVLEQSPTCRLRTAADRRSGSGQEDCSVSK